MARFFLLVIFCFHLNFVLTKQMVCQNMLNRKSSEVERSRFLRTSVAKKGSESGKIKDLKLDNMKRQRQFWQAAKDKTLKAEKEAAAKEKNLDIADSKKARKDYLH